LLGRENQRNFKGLKGWVDLACLRWVDQSAVEMTHPICYIYFYSLAYPNCCLEVGVVSPGWAAHLIV